MNYNTRQDNWIKTSFPQCNAATTRIWGMHRFCAQTFFDVSFEAGGWGTPFLF